MKTKSIFAVAVMALALVAAPAAAQSHKDKKAAKKAQWEMEQRQQREEAELRHQIRMDSIANAKKEQEARERKAEDERRQAEAERKAAERKAQEAKDLQLVEYEEPCSNYSSTSELIRARGEGEDLDHQFSVDLARTAALENLASQVSTKVKGLLTRNRKQGRNGLSRASLQKTEDMVMTEIDQTLSYRPICTKTMTFVEAGARVFKTFMVIEASADELLKNIYDGMQGEEDLQLDMNFDQFKQEFDDHFKQ